VDDASGHSHEPRAFCRLPRFPKLYIDAPGAERIISRTKGSKKGQRAREAVRELRA
jgi:hypothetical protein